VPAVVLALSAGDRLEAYFENMDYVGYFLLITGLLLIVGRYADRKRPVKRDLSWLQAVGIGFAQALALLPGISRSGSTISAGSALGMDRDKAARFAFLMAIPVMCGAVAKKVLDLVKSGQSEQFDTTLLTGLVVSAAVGYVALRLLLRIIHRGNFAWFSGYCFVIGIGVIIYNALT
jgi:undecaprenyl-diphosphatase